MCNRNSPNMDMFDNMGCTFFSTLLSHQITYSVSRVKEGCWYPTSVNLLVMYPVYSIWGVRSSQLYYLLVLSHQITYSVSRVKESCYLACKTCSKSPWVSSICAIVDIIQYQRENKTLELPTFLYGFIEYVPYRTFQTCSRNHQNV